MSSFVTDRPVVGAGKYFGREQLLRSLQTGVGGGRSFLLCGGPRTGRTSSLQQLMQLIATSRQRDPKAARVVPIYLDLATLAAAGGPSLVSGIYRGICSVVVDPMRSGKAGPVRPPELPLSGHDDVWKRLHTTLEALWRLLESTPAWCRYCLLLDGGDILRCASLEASLPSLCAFIKTDAAWAPQAVVIAAGRGLREQLQERESPLSFARPVFLGALKESEALALISAPFEVVEEAFALEVAAQSGRHPYLLQVLLAEHERQRFEASSEGVALACRSVATELFEGIWQELDLGRGVTYRGAYAAPEHALMLYLIERGEPVDLRSAERDLGIKPLKEFVELLEYCGVVERVITGNASRFRASCRLWNAWYEARIRE